MQPPFTPAARSATITPARGPATLLLAGAIFVATGLIYVGLALWTGRTSSPTTAYYPELAGAFVAGRLDLSDSLVNRDLTQHDGAWYLAFPPLPAILMTPEAALRGPAAVNSVRYSLLFGAAAPAFVFLLLQALAAHGAVRRSTGDNLWLTALFAFGSVAAYMALAGTVWLTAQVVGVAFLAAAAWLSATRFHPLLAGTALALAFLSRSSLILMAPFLLGLAAARLSAGGGDNRRQLLRWAALAALPAAAAIAIQLGYNYARFDDAFDFGYATMNVSPRLAELFERYGQFDLRFVPRNLGAMLLATPVWNSSCRALTPDPWGLSLLLTMPALAYLARLRSSTTWSLGAWLAVGLALIPLLLYHNTGYYQFGYRFSLDFLVPLVALLAAAAGPRLTTRFRILVVVGIAVNLWGLAWFFERICTG